MCVSCYLSCRFCSANINFAMALFQRNCNVTDFILLICFCTRVAISIPIPGFAPYFINGPPVLFNQGGLPGPIFPINAQGPWVQNPGIQQNQTQFRNQQEFINTLSFRPRTQGVSSALNTNSPRQSLPNNNSGAWAGIKTFGPTNQNYNNGQQFMNQANGRNFGRDQEQPPQQQIAFIDSNNNLPYQNFGWGWNGFNPNSPVWVDPSNGNGFNGNVQTGQTYPNNPSATPGSGNFDGGNNNLPPQVDGDNDIFIMTRQRSSNSTRSRSASTTSTTTEEPTTTTTTTEPTTTVPELSDSAKALFLSNEAVDRFRRIVTQIREITRRELNSQ